MNILFINQPQSEYGQSLLFHGLTKLGHNVKAYFPNTFHFDALSDCIWECGEANSPCKDMTSKVGCFNHPAHLVLPPSKDFEKPDLIITNNGYGNEALHRLYYDKHDVPIVALDLGDSKNSSYDAWCQVLGGEPDLFFRREYIKGQRGHPLSYSFYKEKSRFRRTIPKYDVAVLYRPTNPLRAEVANKIKSKFPNSLIGELPHEWYLGGIANSKFAVALPGAGEDTLRHWEIPCMGSVLCRMPTSIIINRPFTDGKNCVVFENAEELVDKIEYYLNSSNKRVYNNLRVNSFTHFLDTHTTEKRAAELLEHCRQGGLI